ncbi:hypothetical protein CLOP_g13885 [Closterium sp. NIES-67]|nr:hypothetical protein CLOP_g13885 [Closterium sp. NIES-67]
MPPRGSAQSPRPTGNSPPSALALPLFSARPFLLGAAVALLLSQAALLLRLSSPLSPLRVPPSRDALYPNSAPSLRSADAGGSAAGSDDEGSGEAAVESQGDGDQSQLQSQQQSQDMGALRNVTELAQWAAEIADALAAVFPEMLESRDSFLQRLLKPYPQDTPAPVATCSIPQQRDPDARMLAGVTRSIEAAAIALACSNATLSRSFRRSLCPATSNSGGTIDGNGGRNSSAFSAGNGTDQPDPYDAAGRARLAHVLLSLHQSSSSTWLPPWLSRLLPTWLHPIGWSGAGSKHRPGSQRSQTSQGSHTGDERGRWKSRGGSRGASGGGHESASGRGSVSEAREGEWRFFLSAMAFNRAAAAAAATGGAGVWSEQCQAAAFSTFQWIEYMRYAGAEHVFWYDCACSDAESQATTLSLYSHAGLLTYHRLHHIAPPPAGADYHFDQDTSLSHFLQHHRHESKWVAFADVDEYLFMPPDTRPFFLTRLLLRRPCAAQNSGAGGSRSGDNSVRLGTGEGAGRGRGEGEGSEGEGERPHSLQPVLHRLPTPSPVRLTIERFIHRPLRPPDHHDRLRAKLLLQPAAALGFLSNAPHRALMHSGETLVADPGLIRVNHYWGARGLLVNASEREREEVEDGSMEDRSMQVIADVIKERLRWVLPVLPVLCEREAVRAAMVDARRLADKLQQAVRMENG